MKFDNVRPDGFPPTSLIRRVYSSATLSSMGSFSDPEASEIPFGDDKVALKYQDLTYRHMLHSIYFTAFSSQRLCHSRRESFSIPEACEIPCGDDKVALKYHLPELQAWA